MPAQPIGMPAASQYRFQVDNPLVDAALADDLVGLIGRLSQLGGQLQSVLAPQDPVE